MQTLQDFITALFQDSIALAFGEAYRAVDPVVRVAGNVQHGDYQVNAAMSLAKTLGQKPRDVAQKIVENVRWEDAFDTAPQIAGPGFINVRIKHDVVVKHLADIAKDEARVGVPLAAKPIKVVVDYSGPNVAKEMHVGHLRSSVIGDAIARVLEFKGHTVIRQNHLGDWGTQFGMLIEHMLETHADVQGKGQISDLNKLYQDSKKHFDADAQFAERARARVVMLQSGDQQTRAIWHHLIDESKKHFNDIYQRLDVKLTDNDIRPESFYNDLLPGVVQELEAKNMARPSEGAICVFPEGFVDRDKNPMGVIVRKSDGGYPYAATDLAALRYRAQTLHAGRVIYVTDARQSQHFAMVFTIAKSAGWLTADTRAEHVPFGSVLGDDGKPFKTRSGETVRLIDLLEEAQTRAAAVIGEKRRDQLLDDAEAAKIAAAVGIGAIKYADLSSDRIKDYVFDWNRMLSFDGNTAPYVQNAVVRVRAIFRKAGLKQADAINAPITLAHAAERALALKLLQFPGVIDGVEQALEPHRLTGFLFELASSFHQFYEHCPVLAADVSPELKASRLALAASVDRVLTVGLGLLGIRTLDRM